MDELGGFEPTDTSGFIQIESIRIKKYVSSRVVSPPLNRLFVLCGVLATQSVCLHLHRRPMWTLRGDRDRVPFTY